MNEIRLQVVFEDEIMASIIYDGSHGGHGDYYSIVQVKGLKDIKKVYGVDPTQAFTLGWQFIEQTTRHLRVQEAEKGGCAGSSWTIRTF